MSAGFTIVAPDEMETAGNWLLVRRALGLTAFGMNMVDIAPGERIPEHDETGRDQEEVFIALSGDATMVIDDEEHPLREGSFARIDTHVKRTVANTGSEPIRVLICSAPRNSGYEPMGWA
jgi:mannose-6-phosphate isomerase-like protein (cupin superfamily)